MKLIKLKIVTRNDCPRYDNKNRMAKRKNEQSYVCRQVTIATYQNMFRRVVHNSGRVVGQRRLLHNDEKRKGVFRDFAAFASLHKDALSVAGGLIMVGSIGAYLISDIAIVRRDITKMDDNMQKMDQKIDSNMRELRQEIGDNMRETRREMGDNMREIRREMGDNMQKMEANMREIREYIFANRLVGHVVDSTVQKRND